ncbi:MAG: hypothetical protein GXY44_10420 [Phycisphaerales bacterium]|nr:hypothetical protein [Phycisphaerales bacterium]
MLAWIENKVGVSTVYEYDYSQGDGVDNLGRRATAPEGPGATFRYPFGV